MINDSKNLTPMTLIGDIVFISVLENKNDVPLAIHTRAINNFALLDFILFNSFYYRYLMQPVPSPAQLTSASAPLIVTN